MRTNINHFLSILNRNRIVKEAENELSFNNFTEFWKPDVFIDIKIEGKKIQTATALNSTAKRENINWLWQKRITYTII